MTTVAPRPTAPAAAPAEALRPAPASFTDTDFPMNAWYAAAWDVDVKHALLPRTICKQEDRHVPPQGRPGRGARGRLLASPRAAVARAAGGRHRRLRLSRPEYNAQGRCTHMPSQETINPSACVRSYPVVEKHRFIWLWMGDPALADPALVPDLHWNDDPAWAGDGKTIHVNCDYRLVRRQSHGPDPRDLRARLQHRRRAVAEAPFQTSPTATSTRDRDALDDRHRAAAVLGRRSSARPGPKVDRWQIINFEAPCTIAIDVGVAVTGTGAPEGDRTQGVNGFVLNTMTPETDDTCHYFWAFARNYRINEQRITHRDCARACPAFSARTSSCSRRSSAPSTTIPAAPSTTSTSTPARCGRGA